MYLTSLPLRVEREIPHDTKARSHRLMVQAGFIQQTSAGIFSFSTLLWSVIRRIEKIIREELNAIGFQELMMPALQPTSLWRESGRLEHFQREHTMLSLRDRKDQEFCMGSTYEEVLIDLCRHFVSSYRQLPFRLYQISEKFRDDLRPRFGLVRARQFRMKDGYSFDLNEGGMHVAYQETREAYSKIFERCGISFVVFSDLRGSIGSTFAEKYMARTTEGEESFIHCTHCNFTANYEGSPYCPQCHAATEPLTALELGHIFELGPHYPEKMGALIAGNNGHLSPIWMGDFGIGVSRIPVAIIEQYMDDCGMNWPFHLAPIQIAVVPVMPTNENQVSAASAIARTIKTAFGFETYVDNRTQSFGSRLKDLDFVGSQLQIVVGDRLDNGEVDVQQRNGLNKTTVPIANIVATIENLTKGVHQ